MGGACGSNCGNACSRESERTMNTQPSDHYLPDAALMKTSRRRRILSKKRILVATTSPTTALGEAAIPVDPALTDKDDDHFMTYSETEEDTGDSSPSKVVKKSSNLYRVNTSQRWKEHDLDEAEGELLRLMKHSSGGTSRSDYMYSDSSSTSSGTQISGLSPERKYSPPTVSTRADVMANAKRAKMSPNGRGNKFRGHALDLDKRAPPLSGYESKSISAQCE